MNKYFWFIIILLIFSSCNEESEKPEKWVDNLLLSEKDILIAISLDLNTLLSKSDLANSDQITNQNKMLINAFNSSFKSSLLGFNVDIPQKMFLVSKIQLGFLIRLLIFPHFILGGRPASPGFLH